MFSNFKQVLFFYFISFAIFWTTGSNKPEDKDSCCGYKEKIDAMVTRVDALERVMIMLRNSEPNEKSPPNVSEVKCEKNSLPRNCYELRECQSRSSIINCAGSSIAVPCDFKTANEAWTIFQRRQDDSVDFFRNWTEYVRGFGSIRGEFFIGLESLHSLTTDGNDQQLYIKLEDFEGVQRYARYKKFRVLSSISGYRLVVDGYSGDAGDSLSYSNGHEFYTKDRDNEHNCANDNRGAWWFNHCFESHLNGEYLEGHVDHFSQNDIGIIWGHWRGYSYSLKFTEMMLTDVPDNEKSQKKNTNILTMK